MEGGAPPPISCLEGVKQLQSAFRLVAAVRAGTWLSETASSSSVCSELPYRHYDVNMSNVVKGLNVELVRKKKMVVTLLEAATRLFCVLVVQHCQ